MPGNVEEDNWAVGGHGLTDRTPEARATAVVEGEMKASDENPGALAAVWATSNTRGTIWGAMQARKPSLPAAYMKVRVFAGQGFADAMTATRRW